MRMEEGAFALLDAACRHGAELRRFRHVFRHAYGTELDSAKVGDLAAKAVDVRNVFARDFERFLAALRSGQ